MSPFILAILVTLLVSFLFNPRATSFWSRRHPKNDRKLPPGPPALPIIGNLYMLGSLPHRSLYRLSKKYGPIMSMRLGSIPAIVVSSPQAAELFLKTHDVVFASRPIIQASVYLFYGNKGMVFSEYGPYWRSIRKLCTLQLLSPSKIEYFAPMRMEEVRLLVNSLKKAAAAREAVDISLGVGDLIRNMSCKLVFGEANIYEFDLKLLIEEALNLTGAFNIADYVPFLGAFDLQGLKKRMKAFSKKMDKILEKIIDEHEREAQWQKQQQTRDFVDVLLSLMNQPIASNDESLSTLDRTNIKAILQDMIIGSFDTSAVTIEWTLTELLRHPSAMKRLQDELQSVVGLDKMVQEKDLSNLPYLDMVIKESLRLHPVGPLLIPRSCMEEIIIDGYHIPKKARIIVNAWGIGRDPDVWSDNAEEFLPERFAAKSIDIRGRDFEFLPFGSGRRGCPGMQLGLTVVRLVIAQLVHCFNWELPDGVLPGELDMSEVFGLSLPRASHLVVVPKYRLGI
ncbi:cytochrome P450 CYP736A12-like [Manihot esculenta]|uniref:Uncharacterized protein n=1 Tax=Manihot esculenta TaxID=3983 RepID=A0ACB7IAX2_MANES|nr:cytochrome P450 CYP736A12-like [Manihot esculenta]KAG8661506.1 hypothetical protein MANES_01G010866v8 [Manihot esculenta]